MRRCSHVIDEIAITESLFVPSGVVLTDLESQKKSELAISVSEPEALDQKS